MKGEGALFNILKKYQAFCHSPNALQSSSSCSTWISLKKTFLIKLTTSKAQLTHISKHVHLMFWC